MQAEVAISPQLLRTSRAFLVLLIATNTCLAEFSSEKSLIRAVVPRARQPIVVDGQLAEYRAAFAAPLEYFHPNEKNRPAQFFFLWDDEAFYVGVRTLDETPYSQEHPLWEGDAVEWYFDTRRDEDFLNRNWGKGSLHCFFTPMHLGQLSPRFCLRPGYEDAIDEIGIEVASRATEARIEYEFKLPWVNFPNFQARVGQVIGIDAELSYSDGGPRSDRSFLFGNPLSVQQPANLARVELVEEFSCKHWQMCGPVMMPIRIDVPWQQDTLPQVEAMIAMPPSRAHEISNVEFQLLDLQGELIGRYAADAIETLDATGKFTRRVARWPTTVAIPGRHLVRAVVFGRGGGELARISPRMVSVNMQQGY